MHVSSQFSVLIRWLRSLQLGARVHLEDLFGCHDRPYYTAGTQH